MPRGKSKSAADNGTPIFQYEHLDKQRVNNPPVRLVTPGTDPDAPVNRLAVKIVDDRGIESLKVLGVGD